MLEISHFTCEGMGDGCVTDKAHPSFAYVLIGDKNEIKIKYAVLTVNGEKINAPAGIPVRYDGPDLSPCTRYTARLETETEDGQKAVRILTFSTGFLGTSWTGRWITDETYRFREKKISPRPMTFYRRFCTRQGKKPVRATVYATAVGMYTVLLNNRKISDRFFAPGFTDYRKNLQYQVYDVTDMIGDDNEMVVHVAGGWAVGSFGFTRKNRIYADRQALLAQISVEYDDGTVQVIGTDEEFLVSQEGPYREADLYDGEVYDARINCSQIQYHQVSIEKPKMTPALEAEYGAPVRVFERRSPVSVKHTQEGLLYDFGQNMAAVIYLRVRGEAGQTITGRHAELLDENGRLQTEFLRTAKARFVYICRDGQQEYYPQFTYMGFRYLLLTGVEEQNVQVQAWALSSDMEAEGYFSCSDDLLTRLHSNIYWSARSNFVDIPTDCPQRDERMGWTGDISVFARTALSIFRMDRFLNKWLKDLRGEQKRTGGIPNTIPSAGFGFPETMPVLAVDFWGDACLTVPWALYMQTGSRELLAENYETMKKYVDACRFWAGFLCAGDRKYIWETLHTLHFGDWIAPDVPLMSQWQKRSRYTATASLVRTSGLLAKIADILGKEDDSKKYEQISVRTKRAYRKYLTDGNGRMKEEFQTAYVLPLYFHMLPQEEEKKAADRLARLVRENGYRIGTGFPGTPYILFALADNGYTDEAYAMLLNQTCPSWLYEVVQGATTVWERWDGLDENGRCPIGDDGTDKMISYNHYASGAVGDFFYRRILGVEALEAGFRRFLVRPVIGGNLTWAKGAVPCAFGLIKTEWEIRRSKENGQNTFSLKVYVPVGAQAQIEMPDGAVYHADNGVYTFTCQL